MSDEVAGPAADVEHRAGGVEERIRSVVKDCVHCGFCLPACPTYSLWGEEMDSPRGRIYLVSQLLDGAELTPAAGEHFDRCLGCMACMTACPSGVQYDQIIAAAREWTEDGGNPFAAGSGNGAPGAVAGDGAASSAVAEVAGADGASDGPNAVARRRVAATVPRPVRDRLTRAAIFALFPYPERLRVAIAPLRVLQRTGADRLIARTGLLGRVSPAAEQALRLAPSAAALPGRLPERVAARGARRAVVGMLTGCVQSVFYPRVNA